MVLQNQNKQLVAMKSQNQLQTVCNATAVARGDTLKYTQVYTLIFIGTLRKYGTNESVLIDLLHEF